MCRSVVLDLLEEDRRVGFALDATQLVMEQGQAISPVATILLHEEWLKEKNIKLLQPLFGVATILLHEEWLKAVDQIALNLLKSIHIFPIE
jgi:hypothetical protein